MTPKQVLALFLMLGPLACATGDGSPGCSGGCNGEVSYPYTRPGATLTDKALRLRITEEGLDRLGAALPALLTASCQTSDGDLSAACEFSPTNPSVARFYLGAPCAPVKGDVSLGFTSMGVEVRSGSCGGVEYHRSSVGIYLDALADNLHLNLVQDAAGDGIEVVLGCEDLNDCDQEDYAKFSLDTVVNFQTFGANNSCEIRDDVASEAGVTVRSFRTVLRPRIERDARGNAVLVLEPDDVSAANVDLDFNFGLWEASADPACPNSCYGFCSLGGALSEAVEFFLEQRLLATFLSDMIADLVGSGLQNTTLDASGEMELPTMLGAPDRRSNPMSFVVGPNRDSPDVTGASGARGLNFDLDVGFWGERSACVPRVNPPSWVLPPPVDPGAMVWAPDPVTGVFDWEPFDAALLLGDVSVSRMAYELFDSGNLCVPVTPEWMEEATDGAFSPNVQLVSLLAPGIAALAPGETPVLLALAPNRPVEIRFGDGAARGSHVQVTWSRLEIELYPLLDDAYQRALSFSVDVKASLSLVPTPAGNIQVMVDQLLLGNVRATYNEMGTRFDPGAIEDLVETFLPIVLQGGNLTEIDLSSATLGLPVVPKLRAVQLEGDSERYLGIYLRLCVADALDDPDNPLCYEGESPVRRAPQASVASGGPGALPGTLILEVDDDEVELAWRVDGGLWNAFRAADADALHRFTVRSGALRWPGEHSVEVMTRPVGHPLQWSEPTRLRWLVEAGSAPAVWEFPTTRVELPEVAATPPAAALVPASPAGCSGLGGGGGLWLVWLGLGALVRRRARAA